MGVRAQYDEQYFGSELKIYPDLLDDWIKRTHVHSESHTREETLITDYDIIQKISFYTSGKVTFYAESENRSGITHDGRYRLFADTLVVYFDDRSDVEKYLFRIDDDQLTLQGLWKFEYASYTLVVGNSSTYNRYQSE